MSWAHQARSRQPVRKDSEQEVDDDRVQRFGSQGLPLSQARNTLVGRPARSPSVAAGNCWRAVS